MCFPPQRAIQLTHAFSLGLLLVAFSTTGHGPASELPNVGFLLPSTPTTARNPMPAWAIPVGREFWRPAPAPDSRSLAFRQEAPGRAAQATAPTFQAELHSGELHVAPTHPPATSLPRVALRTRQIGRGALQWRAKGKAAEPWWIQQNTAQWRPAGAWGIVEHWEIRSSGVELTWILPQPLAGCGDLAIEVAAVGPAAVECSGQLQVPPRRPGLVSLKVSPVVVVDSRGARWQFPVEARDGGFRLTVPEAVLSEAAYPLAIDPILTPEFPVDLPVPGPTPATRGGQALAASGSGYLVAWTQGRTESAEPGVFAARLSPTGELLDPPSILISTLAGDHSSCAAAATEGIYLVAWSATRGSSATDWDVLAARITVDGALLDPAPLPICTVSATAQTTPAVAANQDGFLVTWRDARNAGIYGTVVGLDGRLSTTNGIPLLNAANDQYTPAVAALGSNYLVVAQDYRGATAAAYQSDIYAARVDSRGTLLDTNGFVVSTRAGSQFGPAVAAQGDCYLVVWQDPNLAGSDILGARVSAAGKVLDPVAIIVSHAENAQSSPWVTTSGTNFLVTWQDAREAREGAFSAEVYAARVSAAGEVADPGGVRISAGEGGVNAPRAAGRDDEAIVVWQDFRNNPGSVLSDIFGAHLTLTNQLDLQAEFLVQRAPNAQLQPHLARRGDCFLAVWADNRSPTGSGWDIYGVRFDPAGVAIDPAPFPICTATNRQAEPVVMAGDEGFLVVWTDYRNTAPTLRHADIYGCVVGFDGEVKHPGGIPICTIGDHQSAPAATRFGTNFFVVWQDARGTQVPNVRQDIYGARVTTLGQVLDPEGFPICTQAALQSDPVVSATANAALVAWTDHRLSNTYPDIYGARITPDGSVLDTNGLRICTTSGSTQNLAALATDGSEFLAVWADSRNGSSRAPDIYGTFISGDGTPTPTNGFPLRLATGPQTVPQVAFNGSDYLVVWQEAAANIQASGIVGVQVEPGWPVRMGPLLPLATNALGRTSPALAAGPDRRFLVLSLGPRDSVWRAVGTLVDSEAVPRLDEPLVLEDRRFQFRFRGAVGQRYAIEFSDDLQNWGSFGVFTNLSPAGTVIDPEAGGIPARSYRAVLFP